MRWNRSELYTKSTGKRHSRVVKTKYGKNLLIHQLLSRYQISILISSLCDIILFILILFLSRHYRCHVNLYSSKYATNKLFVNLFSLCLSVDGLWIWLTWFEIYKILIEKYFIDVSLLLNRFSNIRLGTILNEMKHKIQ